jgi:hypothetical protein
MPDEYALSRIHYELIRGLVEQFACPTNSELARQLQVSTGQVEELLVALSNMHGVVLHPHICEPWVIHPFSVTPTINWIQGQRGSWWAPCVWCALGVACVVGGEVEIYTRFGGQAEPLRIRVIEGEPDGLDGVWVHFAIPPSKAWQNVHQHCSLVLPFHSPEQIREWCIQHHAPHGQAVPLGQVARLARLWYGSHSDPAWHKWSVAEAQDIFRRAELNSPFWDLEPRSGRF